VSPCTKRSQLCEIKLVGKVEKEVDSKRSVMRTYVCETLLFVRNSVLNYRMAVPSYKHRPFSPRQKQPTLSRFYRLTVSLLQTHFHHLQNLLDEQNLPLRSEDNNDGKSEHFYSLLFLICASFYCALGVAWNGAILHLLLLFWAVDWL
jgi:hypothetical protein